MNFNAILKSCILSGCDEVDTKAAVLKNLPEYFFFQEFGDKNDSDIQDSNQEGEKYLNIPPTW